MHRFLNVCKCARSSTSFAAKILVIRVSSPCMSILSRSFETFPSYNSKIITPFSESNLDTELSYLVPALRTLLQLAKEEELQEQARMMY